MIPVRPAHVVGWNLDCVSERLPWRRLAERVVPGRLTAHMKPMRVKIRHARVAEGIVITRVGTARKRVYKLNVHDVPGLHAQRRPRHHPVIEACLHAAHSALR